MEKKKSMQIHGKGKCKNAEDLTVCSSQMTTGQKQGQKCSTVLKKIRTIKVLVQRATEALTLKIAVFLEMIY